MSNDGGGWSCAQRCWGLALVSGVIAAFLLMVGGDWRLLPAVFACIVIAIIVGALLQWFACKPAPVFTAAPQVARTAAPITPQPAPAATVEADPVKPAPQQAPAPREPETVEPETMEPVVPAAADTSEAASIVKPSKALAGEAELAARKGTWKFDGGTSRARPDSAPVVAAEPASAPGKAAAPDRLSAARAGGPDDLTMIKGVGPKLERLLHSMGFFHFDQIASWTEKEVAWVDTNLEGFKGRVSRDNWVEQARALAGGGTMEVSNKLSKGDVHEGRRDG